MIVHLINLFILQTIKHLKPKTKLNEKTIRD